MTLLLKPLLLPAMSGSIGDGLRSIGFRSLAHEVISHIQKIDPRCTLKLWISIRHSGLLRSKRGRGVPVHRVANHGGDGT